MSGEPFVTGDRVIRAVDAAELDSLTGTVTGPVTALGFEGFVMVRWGRSRYSTGEPASSLLPYAEDDHDF
jgi:hypothetical protein